MSTCCLVAFLLHVATTRRLVEDNDRARKILTALCSSVLDEDTAIDFLDDAAILPHEVRAMCAKEADNRGFCKHVRNCIMSVADLGQDCGRDIADRLLASFQSRQECPALQEWFPNILQLFGVAIDGAILVGDFRSDAM